MRGGAWRGAVLLVESRRGAVEVAACCERSGRAGVQAGMSLAQARVLLGRRTALEKPHTPIDDAAELEKLTLWATRFSPIVAADPPDGLLLDVAGCEHLFGGVRELLEELRSGLQAQGWTARLAAAPTFACAWAAARCGKAEPGPVGRKPRRGAEICGIRIVEDGGVEEALCDLPVAALRLEEDQIEALAEVGLEQIGQLGRVPREELGARFGVGLVRRLDQARGLLPEPLRSVLAESPPRVRRIFDGNVTQIESIERAARELLDALVEVLQEGCQGVRRLLIELHRIDDATTRIELPLTYPCQDTEHLWRLLRPRLERVQMGFGVEELAVEATRADVVASQPLALWDRQQIGELAVSDKARGELLDRLMDRFGPSAVQRVEVREEYAPERAFRLVETGNDDWAVQNRLLKMNGDEREEQAVRKSGVTKTGWPKAAAKKKPSEQRETRVLPAERPTFLFDTPEPIRVIAVYPDGPPRRIHWRGRDYEIAHGLGPERLALPWWREEAGQGRDYFALRETSGRWLWVFRTSNSEARGGVNADGGLRVTESGNGDCSNPPSEIRDPPSEAEGWFLQGMWS